MARKRILGEIKLKFISKGDGLPFTIVIDGHYRDDRYKNTINSIKESITGALSELSDESKRGKHD